MFSEELNFFISHQEELVAQHRGKYLALKGNQVLGAYPTVLEAYLMTQKDHELGSFMIQPCEPGPEAYTTTIVSTHVTLDAVHA